MPSEQGETHLAGRYESQNDLYRREWIIPDLPAWFSSARRIADKSLALRRKIARKRKIDAVFYLTRKRIREEC